MPLGRRNFPARIEVHIRNRGFRVTYPKCVKDDKPWVAWSDYDGDIEAAWKEVQQRALNKIRSLHPDSAM
jgi:hypothetical protein